MIQSNYMPGKIKKILEGQEPTAQFYNKAFGKYDAVVEEGLNTSTQKQMQFAQMLQLKEMGVPISAEDLLEAATLQNKKRIIENLTKTEQAQGQLQQQQAQMAMELQQAQIELARARAQADIGLGVERSSRVEENRALALQKLHQANADDQRATLDKIKALKDLEMMDLDHIGKLIAMVNSLKAGENIESKTDIDEQPEAYVPELDNQVAQPSAPFVG
jgi:hypothetical protein